MLQVVGDSGAASGKRSAGGGSTWFPGCVRLTSTCPAWVPPLSGSCRRAEMKAVERVIGSFSGLVKRSRLFRLLKMRRGPEWCHWCFHRYLAAMVGRGESHRSHREGEREKRGPRGKCCLALQLRGGLQLRRQQDLLVEDDGVRWLRSSYLSHW